MLWIAVGSAPYAENPYGPAWAWTGEYPGEDLCPACGSDAPGGEYGPCNVCSPATTPDPLAAGSAS